MLGLSNSEFGMRNAELNGGNMKGPTMKTLRFGVIGCGGMGSLHVMNSKFVPGMQVVAYADVKRENADKFLKDFGGEYATTDIDRLIGDKSLDGVLIQTGEKHHP